MPKLAIPFLVWITGVGSLLGESIRFPKFSKPLLQGDRLVCASPDSKRVLCIGLDGTKLWEKSFSNRVYLFEGPDSEPLLQTGKVVSLLLTKSGDLKLRFTVEDENDRVSYVKEGGIFVSQDRRFKERMFKVLDEKTGKPLWRSAEAESLICVTPELFVMLAAERIPSGPGYTFGGASLEAFDGITFKKEWSVPVKEGSPFLASAFKAPYLVYADGNNSLTVLNCTTGRKLVSKAMELSEYGGWISDVEIHGGDVVWLTHKLNLGDFNQTEHVLHYCALPDLEEKKTVTLRLIEIARIAFEGEFIISDALYRTACFRMNGEKVWERFQSNRTASTDNRIYFSDYEKGITRLGYVEVSTGKEMILYSESVK